MSIASVVSVTELRHAVLAIAGIAAAEIEPRQNRGPSVRVWLDGSRPSAAVSRELQDVLRDAGYRTRSEVAERPRGSGSLGEDTPDVDLKSIGAETPPVGNGGARRAGLGRGLDALIPAPQRDIGSAPNRLELIAIEESSDGTLVRAIDAAGRSAVAPVPNDRSLNQAVAATVAGLLGLGAPPELLAVEVHQLGGSPVLVTLLEIDGKRASGSAVIESGMPFALGSAIWSALRSLV